MEILIDYGIINDSISFYETYDFKRVESPWTVTKAISDITKPEGATEFSITEKNKVLVASGEQSFLYLFNKGFLPHGRYQTVTPCFRDESFDELHTKYFIKNELIQTGNVSREALHNVMLAARLFFKQYLEVSYTRTGEDSWDLMHGDIELGSYGIRSCPFLKWIYGTGVAEPRLSKVINGISH